MDLRLLRYFVTVIDAGSYTKAAKTLYISQPSLSNAIKQLESNLNVTLIDRSKRVLELTDEGKVLYFESTRLINHSLYVKEVMERLEKEGPPEISIGIIESANFWIMQVLKSFVKEYPNTKIKLLDVLELKDTENALNNYDVHIAITNQLMRQENMRTIQLYTEDLVVLLPLEHPLNRKSELTIEDLTDVSLILPKQGFQTRNDILTAMRQAGKTPQIKFEIGRFDVAYLLVENNFGITVIPENYVKYLPNQKINIKRLNNLKTKRTVYIAYDNNRYLPPIIWSLVDDIKSFFKLPNQ